MNLPLVELLLLALFGLSLAVSSLRLGKSSSVLNATVGLPGTALCLGIAFSAIVTFGGASTAFQNVLRFKEEVFLYAILPTIIADAGLNIDVHMFLLNAGCIFNTAFVGTTISTFVIGLMQWAFGLAGIAYKMSLLHNLVFGALLSATGNLYANVFGEAVINDASSLVLFDTISSFLAYEGTTVTPINAREIFRAIGTFIGIFVGSCVMGLLFGLILALILRSGLFRLQAPLYETGLVVVFLYTSYLSAVVASMSGIVSLLFCGMMVQSYVKPLLSTESVQQFYPMFSTLAGLLDVFLFVYIGMSVFTLSTLNTWRFAALCLISMAVGRAVAIIPCVALPNIMRAPARRLGAAMQFMMWWSGLRGAMAFSLAILAVERYGADGEVMRSCTFYMIFMTVIINGGSTGWLLKKLKLTETDRLDSIRDTRAQEGSLSSSPIALHAHTNPVFAKGAGMEMEMGHYPGSPTSSQLMHPPHSPSSPTPATHQHKTPQELQDELHKQQAWERQQARRPGCLAWLHSHDLWLYNTLMGIDRQYLSKWLKPPPSMAEGHGVQEVLA